jgi:GxxExxY protein
VVYRSDVAGQIIGCAIKVHRALGPGLLESAYQKCLGYEMQRAGLRVEAEVAVPLRYGDVTLDCGYRLDFLVEGSVIVEVKSVERLMPIHKAQALTYLRLTGIGQALLLNFCVSVMKNGISSLVNHRLDSQRDVGSWENSS